MGGRFIPAKSYHESKTPAKIFSSEVSLVRGSAATQRESLRPKLRDISGYSRGSWWPAWDTSPFIDVYMLRASQQSSPWVPSLSYDVYIEQIC